MAKMIPDFIEKEDPRRGGERLVYEWLSNDNIPGTVYYSLLQKNHQHKLIGEVDFLYVCDRGLLCIEVKGGQNIYCSDKKWFSINKRNMTNVIHNPFIQAKDCMYSLKNYLIDVYGKKSKQSKYLIGYAVIFPECIFTGTGNDLVTEVMYDASNKLNGLFNFLHDTFNYWESLEIERHGYKPEKLDKIQLEQINDLLRGDFRVVPSMSLELQHIEQKMIKLTDEQFEGLDITNENDRVLIQGVAGTGKTLLALEVVRRKAAMEKSVLYLCFNKNMAHYAEDSLKVVNKKLVKISTFHALIQECLQNYNLFDKNIGELSELFLQNHMKIRSFDYIIIDEGQDLMDIAALEVIDKLLNNGLINGQWVIFLDPNQNIFIKTETYEFAFEYLKEVCHPTKFTLNNNCRNTKQIAERTSLLTATPHTKYLKIDGPKVVVNKYIDKSDLIKQLKVIITSLFASGVSPLDIVLLSRYKLCNSEISSLNSICNLEIIEKDNITDFGPKCLNYFTIQAFKGLESKIVILLDIDGYKSLNNRILNYVAMSRAKILLYIFNNELCTTEYKEMIDKSIEFLL